MCGRCEALLLASCAELAHILARPRAWRAPFTMLVVLGSPTPRCTCGWMSAKRGARVTRRGLVSQVRQRLYSSAVGRWRQYTAELRPAAEVLQPLVDAYEDELRDLGLLTDEHPAFHDEL